MEIIVHPRIKTIMSMITLTSFFSETIINRPSPDAAQGMGHVSGKRERKSKHEISALWAGESILAAEAERDAAKDT